MRTAERNFEYGVYAGDLAASALANRAAAGNSALVVGSFGAERYRFLLSARGVAVMTLPACPQKKDVEGAAEALRAHREGFSAAPNAVFVPKWGNVPAGSLLLQAADLVALLLPVSRASDIPPVFSPDLAELYRQYIVMHCDDFDGIDSSVPGWAALSFEPRRSWTPDGAVWT